MMTVRALLWLTLLVGAWSGATLAAQPADDGWPLPVVNGDFEFYEVVFQQRSAAPF